MGPVVFANSWTHIATTYSPANGLRLYVNGSLYNASLPFAFLGSHAPTYVFVGSSREAYSNPWFQDIVGQYSGVVDELRVYSRQLSPTDVLNLANPST